MNSFANSRDRFVVPSAETKEKQPKRRAWRQLISSEVNRGPGLPAASRSCLGGAAAGEKAKAVIIVAIMNREERRPERECEHRTLIIVRWAEEAKIGFWEKWEDLQRLGGSRNFEAKD
ncbi:hypothetical protein L596_028067 [Steinernema carpocapsae]|uniref:Uncharacterized protein n=1 Tax=Steinernema carpocapsae TaxID=34508 RepID=A0A4V5ZXS4_STECR|nr:hypothetical protein L596_028067 [Steinernema carpocapsae]